MPVTTRSASKKNLTASVDTQPKFNEFQGNMRLRSGKVLRDPPVKKAKTQVSKKDPTYVQHSPVVASTLQYYARVRKREIEEAVTQCIKRIESFINLFESPATQNASDPWMEKIRIITELYKYANSVSTQTIMHERVRKLLGNMLRQCVDFLKDANEIVAKRIERVEPKYKRENEEYYKSKLDVMQHELDKFTHAYANQV